MDEFSIFHRGSLGRCNLRPELNDRFRAHSTNVVPPLLHFVMQDSASFAYYIVIPAAFRKGDARIGS